MNIGILPIDEKLTEVDDDDDDDYTGCFLEPTGNSINMLEKIAEANRKLYEDETSIEEISERPKKVQFSESLINFEPETYDSDEFDNSEDGGEQLEELNDNIRKRRELLKSEREELKEEEILMDVKRESTIPEEIEEEDQDTKVLLVMLPREQSSSCESVIGEEISCETKDDNSKVECIKEDDAPTINKPIKMNRTQSPSPCKISKISLEGKSSPKIYPKKERVKLGIKYKKTKEEEKEADELKNSAEGKKMGEGESTGEKFGKRKCCIVRTDLPKYNGLRSEYGLSADQLQERKRKTIELRQQRRAIKMKKKEEEIQRKIENEESFIQWLYSKRRGMKEKRPTQVDTLSRSDIYIQTHAVYASRRGVFYSVEYGLTNKKKTKTPRMIISEGKSEKSINLEKLFDNVSPHVNHTYRICIGEQK